MELFLNLVWLTLSTSLLVYWTRSIRRGRIRFEWSACIAICLLIVLLFPVISMTDDLIAFSAPAEAEHTLRRSEAPLALASSPGLLPLDLLFHVVAAPSQTPTLPRHATPPPTLSAILCTLRTRAIGVRPPPILSGPPALA